MQSLTAFSMPTFPFRGWLCVAALLIGIFPAAPSMSDPPTARPWQTLSVPHVAEAAAHFADPPAEYALAMWWFWNGDMTEANIRRDLAELKARGVRAVMIWPYNGLVNLEYLSPAWFERVKFAVGEARRLDMRVWLTDEGCYPSGFVGGKVTRERPQQRMQILAAKKNDRGGLDVQPIFRTAATRYIHAPGFRKDETYSLFDALNAEATADFLRDVHEQYRKVLGAEFGRTVLGVMGDEPSFPGVPYTPGIFDQFKRRKGYDVEPHLADLFQQQPTEAARRIRADYWDVWSSLYRDNFFRPQVDWCARQGLEFLLHLCGEEDQKTLIALDGDYFKCMQPVQVPGVDAIWRQVWPDKTADYPKLASSAAHLGGRPRAFCEGYAVYGRGLSVEQAKWVLDALFVRGINLFQTMSYLSSREEFRPYFCPPDLNLSPQWPHFSQLFAYANRMSYLLSSGKPAAAIAVYYPTTSGWLGDFTADAATLNAARRLLEEQRDFDFLDEDSLQTGLRIEGATLVNRSGQGYRAVLVPPVKVISQAGLKQLEEFARSGGTVIFLGRPPELVAGRTYRDAAPGPKTLPWAHVTTESELSAATLARLPQPDLTVEQVAPAGLRANLKYVHHRLADGELYFLFNESAQPLDLTVRLQGQGVPQFWNAVTGVRKRAVASVQEGSVHIPLTLDSYETRTIVLGPAQDAPVDSYAQRQPSAHRLAMEGDWQFTIGGRSHQGPLKSWSDYGRPGFSGTVRYRKEFAVAADLANDHRNLTLDLGEVRYSARVLLNGKDLGVRAWRPFRWLVGDALRSGGNVLEVEVTNTAANELAGDPSRVKELERKGWLRNSYIGRYLAFDKEMVPSGLLGPVRLCASAIAAAPPLPAPIDIPSPPAAADDTGLGGANLPAMAGPAVAAAPAISMVSEVTFPDETLVVTGAGLKGARLRIWAEGQLRDIEPLRTADDRLQAVVPKELPVSTMLVWPVRGELVGAPMRVNGATAWWSWPVRMPARCAGQTVRLFGKNLSLAGARPRVFLAGPNCARFLNISVTEPYHLEAALPDDLGAGAYRVYAHNGSGGAYGWSEPMAFEVVAGPAIAAVKQFAVRNFGAVADDGRDDCAAIAAAVAAAEKAGGGAVVFAPGVYHVSQPITVGAAVSLSGAGMGNHDPKDHSSSGACTRIEGLPGVELPSEIIAFRGPGGSLRNMSLYGASDGRKQVVVGVYAPDVVVERMRLIQVDARDWATWRAKDRLVLDSGVLFINAPGAANIVVRDCELHAPGPGVMIGNLQPGHGDAASPEPSSNYIRIERVKIRGYYAGEPLKKSFPYASGRSIGVAIHNGKNITVEHCDLASADRAHGRVLGRTVMAFNTSTRHLYLAHNRSLNVGSHPSAPGMHTNQGEQYLFHLRYPQGGLFRVTQAAAQELTITTAGIRPERDGPDPHAWWGTGGGRILDEVGANPHWIVFVCAGRGVGQVREVSGMRRDGEQATLSLTQPWRVTPDAASRVNLLVAYRNITLYDNCVDQGELVPTHKSHGVCFWYVAFDNIVANNTFKNLASGVIFNTGYRNPTGWNLTRENTMQNMTGFSGDTSLEAAFYVDHYRVYGQSAPRPYRHRWPPPEDRVWNSVGNAARSNHGEGGDVAAFLHARFGGRQPPVYVSHPESGLMMSVIENNDFCGAKRGLVLTPPANWAVIRQNKIVTTNPGQAPVNVEAAEYVVKPLILDNRPAGP